MKVYYLTPDEQGNVIWPRLDPKVSSVVTLGTFDGVHRGHQAVLKRVVELAKSYNSRSVAIVFDRRPGFLFSWIAQHGEEPAASEPDTQQLSTVDQRLKYIAETGIDIAIVVHFTQAFSQISYSAFLGQLISQRVENSRQPVHTLGMTRLVLGQDADFGRDRGGNVKSVQRLSEAFRMFDLEVVDYKGPGFIHVPAGVVDGKQVEKKVRVWSSTAVRNSLEQMKVSQAMEILGHPHAVDGTVVHGEARGRTLGFPTANFAPDYEGLLPADGVYSGWLIDYGPADSLPAPASVAALSATPGSVTKGEIISTQPAEVARWTAAISVGTNPTFGPHARVLEVFAVENDWLDLYGHRVRVEFADTTGQMVKAETLDNLTELISQEVRDSQKQCDGGWTDSITGEHIQGTVVDWAGPVIRES